jgi:hypothetical protein
MSWFLRLFNVFQPPAPPPLACPRCGGTNFYEGPSGGGSTNIMCTNPHCEHWFNYHYEVIPMDDLHMAGYERRHDE